MELDFSKEWRIIGAATIGREEGPSAAASAELASVLGRMGCRPPASGGEDATERIIVLNAGLGGKGARLFSWRASADRVEIYGGNEAALLRGVYDFLGALGARWPAPGARGERLPAGPVLSLEIQSRSSSDAALPATLALGHGAFLERYEDYLLWAARVGYSSVLIRVTRDALALEGAPESLYESLRDDIARLARRLGLSLELGLSLQPRLSLEPRLAIGASSRAPAAFAEYALAHPEITVFHAWPESPWTGEDRACPHHAEPQPDSKPAASIDLAIDLAAALERVRPDAALSLLASEEDEELPNAALGARPLPRNLELLWAPRRRSWGHPLGDSGSSVNATSIALFRRTAEAWRSAGGGRVVALERYEDAFLFKGAAPPLSVAIEGDLAAYRGSGIDDGADAIGILCGGGRLPVGPRPNAALLPILAAWPSRKAEAALDEWARAAYGEASVPMLDYWRELEAAWAVDLDLNEGEAEVHAPESLSPAASPPADWGDPWKAGAGRLAEKRARCEELFDHLRRAESSLAEGRAAADVGKATGDSVLDEADEYAISGSILELNCARLSAYHELAEGDARAAADIANLALSAEAAVRKAFARLPDPRARREMRLTIDLFYDQRLREMRRANARSALRRLLDLWHTKARIASEIRITSCAYEPGRARGRREKPKALAWGLVRKEQGH
jgi:hypothetical protein